MTTTGDAFAYSDVKGPQGRSGIAAGEQSRCQCQGQQWHDPFVSAALKGHNDVMELLLANQADVNARDNNGNTPLKLTGGSWKQGRGGIAAGQQGRC